jgi:virginiamycin B lyase
MRYRLLTFLLVAHLIPLTFAPARSMAQSPLAATPAAVCLTLQTFPVPAGDGPHDVAPAADATGVWYTGQRAGVLGLLDPTTGKTERVLLGAGSAPHGVVVGPDGAAWVTDGGLNAIVRVDATTHAVQTFPLPPEGAQAALNTAAFDTNGILWFTGQNGVVGRLDPATQEVRVWPAPRGRGPYGITATPRGAVYYTSLAGSYLGQIAPDGDDVYITALDPPTTSAGVRRVWSDSHGLLWVSEWTAGQVGRFDPAAGTWREWPLPGDTPQAYAVYVDDHDAVWLSDFGANALVRFDPASETFASLPLPDPGASVRQLAGRPGEVWGAESATDKLVRVRSTC